jgi:hypothetical protein
MADFALADDFLPIYDVSDAVATVADADRDTAWRALVDVDLKLDREAPVAGMGASPAWTACPSASSSGAPHTLPPNVRVGRPFGGHCRLAQAVRCRATWPRRIHERSAAVARPEAKSPLPLPQPLRYAEAAISGRRGQ